MSNRILENSKPRRGDWITTRHGVQFWPLDPRVEDIDLADIVHALSLICRWGGHCRTHYSVGQHSVLVADLVWELTQDPYLALTALLHDATEAYIGDMVTPLKRNMPAFKRAEARLEKVIMRRFGLFGRYAVGRKFVMPDPVVHGDMVLLATEKRDLTNQRTAHLWDVPKAPLDVEIVPWAPYLTRRRFLSRFNQFTKLIAKRASAGLAYGSALPQAA